ncbi:MAG TPA: hypothetical protein VMD58_10365 [Acidobacteriaceae bacterium]|nr:hypothetical protein [Acidobacteriaceae bacterium]
MAVAVIFAVLIIIIILTLKVIAIKDAREAEKIAAMSPDDRQKYLQKKQERFDAAQAILLTQEYGEINPKMICPHCQWMNCVRLKTVKRKKGISGSKATAAVLTGGVSVLATGLSRKEQETQAFCANCKTTWFF